MLTHLLETGCGSLDEPTRRRIAEADPDTLLEWADRILKAERIEDVLA